MPTTLVAVDLETTGLGPDCHITQFGWVVRLPDGTETEHVAYPTHSLDNAEPTALELTRYWETIATQPREPFADVVARFLTDAAGQDGKGATLVCANPCFDSTRILAGARAVGLTVGAPWHHRLCDVEALAAPYVSAPNERIPGLKDVAEALGVDYDLTAHHDALYDARLALTVYDAVWERRAADAAALTATAA